MSFNDISPAKSNTSSSISRGAGGVRSSNGSGSTSRSASIGGDAVSKLSDSILLFQRQIMSIKEKVTEYRRKKCISAVDKCELDMQFRDLREHESRLKVSMDSEVKQLDSTARTPENAQKRIALGKLQKDFERVKVGIAGLVNEASLIKVNKDAGAAGGGYNGNERGVFNRLGEMNSDDSKQSPKLIQAMQGKDVDDLIMEERERDIKKLNTDLALVHEMFKDMATIVEKQGAMVEEIATSTETSYERSKAGLEQVQQAANHQSTCIVS